LFTKFKFGQLLSFGARRAFQHACALTRSAPRICLKFKHSSIVTVALLCFVFACSTSKVDDAEKKYNSLEIGMSTEQVKTLLGEPSLREGKENKEVWYYSAGMGRDLEFKDKKLSSFARPKTETPVNVEGHNIPPKDIGDKCDSDKQCLSGDCLLNRCVGRNNCWRKVGMTCTQQFDCCDSICDFGICKPR
jgi:hypothetical protein